MLSTTALPESPCSVRRYLLSSLQQRDYDQFLGCLPNLSIPTIGDLRVSRPHEPHRPTTSSSPRVLDSVPTPCPRTPGTPPPRQSDAKALNKFLSVHHHLLVPPADSSPCWQFCVRPGFRFTSALLSKMSGTSAPARDKPRASACLVFWLLCRCWECQRVSSLLPCDLTRLCIDVQTDGEKSSSPREARPSTRMRQASAASNGHAPAQPQRPGWHEPGPFRVTADIGRGFSLFFFFSSPSGAARSG